MSIMSRRRQRDEKLSAAQEENAAKKLGKPAPVAEEAPKEEAPKAKESKHKKG